MKSTVVKIPQNTRNGVKCRITEKQLRMFSDKVNRATVVQCNKKCKKYFCKWWWYVNALIWMFNILFLELILSEISAVFVFFKIVLFIDLLIPNQRGSHFITKHFLFCIKCWIQCFKTSDLFFSECAFLWFVTFLLRLLLSVWVNICILNMFHEFAIFTIKHLEIKNEEF